MKYYKDNKGNVCAYEEDGSQDHLIGDKVAMTAEEVEAHINPPKTTDQLENEAKQAKDLALSTITVTTSNGNTFDGNETARINMISAITTADIVGITEKEWKLADNSIKVIQLSELKEALLLSIQKVGEIVL